MFHFLRQPGAVYPQVRERFTVSVCIGGPRGFPRCFPRSCPGRFPISGDRDRSKLVRFPVVLGGCLMRKAPDPPGSPDGLSACVRYIIYSARLRGRIKSRLFGSCVLTGFLLKSRRLFILRVRAGVIRFAKVF
jgi:hypothetical protein